MPGRPAVVAAARFAGEAVSVTQARALVARTLGAGWPGLDDVLVMVSELASNAVRHTASGSGGVFGVAVSAAGHTARIEVTDAGAKTRPEIPDPDPDPDADLSGDGGRGLRIVDTLADGWGHDGDETGRVVWFEVTSRRLGQEVDTAVAGVIDGGYGQSAGELSRLHRGSGRQGDVWRT